MLAFLICQALPPVLRMQWSVDKQALFGMIFVHFVEAGVFFLQERSTPFTELRARSVNDLSLAVVMYFVLFPLSAFALVAGEPWVEFPRTHSLIAILLAALLFRLLQVLDRKGSDGMDKGSDMEKDALLPGEIGLRH